MSSLVIIPLVGEREESMDGFKRGWGNLADAAAATPVLPMSSVQGCAAFSVRFDCPPTGTVEENERKVTKDLWIPARTIRARSSLSARKACSDVSKPLPPRPA